MGSAFHHNTCLHANDLVGILDGAQPVSHNNDGLLTTVDELIKRCLHQSLRLCVKGGCGLVEEEQLWFADKGTSDRNALLLASGKLDASFTDSSLINVREELKVVQEVVCIRLVASIIDHGFNLRVSLVIELEAVGDILTNRAREEHGLLLHDCDLLVEPLGVKLLDVASVEEDLTLIWVIEALHK